MITRVRQLYLNRSSEQKRWIKRFLFPAIVLLQFSRKFRVYLLSGNRQVMYATTTEINPYVIEQFCQNAAITKLTDVRGWELKSFLQRYPEVMIDMDEILMPFFKNGVFMVSWVRQIVELNKPFSEIVKKMRSRKKIPEFEFEISSKSEDLLFFYRQLYLPYITKRHKNATIDDFSTMQTNFQGGEVIFLSQHGSRRAGAVIRWDKGTYYMQYVGLQDEHDLHHGALEVLYYYTIRRAMERGMNRVDLGLSRPFLSDGVLWHKRKLGAKITLDRENERVIFLKNLHKNHLLVREGNTITALVSSPADPFIHDYEQSGITFRIVPLL